MLFAISYRAAGKEGRCFEFAKKNAKTNIFFPSLRSISCDSNNEQGPKLFRDPPFEIRGAFLQFDERGEREAR